MHDLLHATRALYEAMHRFDGAAADQLGIHRSDLRCLNALELGPLTPGQLGERLGLTSGSVTALVNRLRSAGLVERLPSPDDGRSSQVALRATAFKRVDTVYAALGASIGSAFEGVSDTRLAAMADGVATLAMAFDMATHVATDAAKDGSHR
jgi:DNA-binding MarR family transcriptional regulator